MPVCQPPRRLAALSFVLLCALPVRAGTDAADPTLRAEAAAERAEAAARRAEEAAARTERAAERLERVIEEWLRREGARR